MLYLSGSPFSTSSLEMSRSSTMPLNENEDAKGYFSMASIKSMTKTGTSRLSTLKKSSIASASSWMSPNSKESLNKGISSLRNVYSTATTSISKRVEEYQNTRNLNEAPTQNSSNPNLTIKENTEDTVSLNSNTEKFVDQPDSWSNFTGQLWDQIWSYNSNSNQPSTMPNQNIKDFADLFEQMYERMPRTICGATAMELIMTSCSRCKNCDLILYDEEIISGWSAEDSNLNTKCPFCSKMVVPHLTIKVSDLRVEPDQTPIETPIQVPYLSPLVLRKELECILEREGDACLSDVECVNDHPIIYWNLIWYFERIGVNSHLPGMCLSATSLNKHKIPTLWTDMDHRNVQIKLKWDNELFNDEFGIPLYLQEKNEIIRQICDGVQHRDLFVPLKDMLEAKANESKKRSIYRQMMFVTLKSFGQDNIDLTAFDREYRRAFVKLPGNYVEMLCPSDRPPNDLTVMCRKFFRELKI